MTSPYTFLSYSRTDFELALKIVGEIRRAGGNIWIDKLDIKMGRRWDSETEKALTGCETVLVILTPESVNSHNVLDEISFAIEEDKTIIPILACKCQVPLRLRRFQQIDFLKDFGEGMNQVYEALNLGNVQMNERKDIKKDEVEKSKPGNDKENITDENDSSKTNWVCITNETHKFSEKKAEENDYFCPKCPPYEGILIRQN